ncbi:MAG: 4Fe-4S dicluster domain-containing protein [Sporomusa sp.]
MLTTIIDVNYCKGCNLCVAICPKEALVKGHNRNSKGYIVPDSKADKCVNCKNCEIVCPELAISLTKEA